MQIRPLELRDVEDLQRIKKQVESRLGFSLDLPDFVVGSNGLYRINPRFASAMVFLDDKQVPSMATILKKTTEAYLLMDMTKVGYTELISRFTCLQKATHLDAIEKGVFDTFTFLSPHLASTWSRLLESPELGWGREPWAVWRKIHGK